MSCHVSLILMNEVEWLFLVSPVTLFPHVRIPAVVLFIFLSHWLCWKFWSCSFSSWPKYFHEGQLFWCALDLALRSLSIRGVDIDCSPIGVLTLFDWAPFIYYSGHSFLEYLCLQIRIWLWCYIVPVMWQGLRLSRSSLFQLWLAWWQWCISVCIWLQRTE